MNEYKFKVCDENFKTEISVQARNIVIAKDKAKMQFAEKFNTYLKNIKIELLDVEEHIKEIMSLLYEG